MIWWKLRVVSLICSLIQCLTPNDRADAMMQSFPFSYHRQDLFCNSTMYALCISCFSLFRIVLPFSVHLMKVYFAMYIYIHT